MVVREPDLGANMASGGLAAAMPSSSAWNGQSTTEQQLGTSEPPSPAREGASNGSSKTLSLVNSSKMLQALAQENALKFGDEIRLYCRSNFLKKPKPAFMDPDHKGWTAEELKGGYIGVYTKPDKTTRVLVPPVGNLARGEFRESYFRVEDVIAGQESYGKTVTYGAVVVLVDDEGMVWNNKTGGLFLDGYLSPRPRGEPGEVFVSFHKNGKRGEPVQYGDVGVFIDVEDSHRFRVGFNNRITNYKGTFSSLAGGYLSSDGSGEPITLIVERYKGKIKPRPGAPELPLASSNASQASPATLPIKQTQKTVRSIASVSVITLGVRNTMKISPKFGTSVVLYGLRQDNQIEIVLDDQSTVLVDGLEMLDKATTSKKCEVSNAQGGRDFLILQWKRETKASYQQQHERPTSNLDVVKAIVLLVTVYIVLFFLVVVAWSYVDEDALMLQWTETRRGKSFTYPRSFKRARAFATIMCWLAGLATPKAFFNARTSKTAKNDSEGQQELVILTINFEHGTVAESPLKVQLSELRAPSMKLPNGTDTTSQANGETIEDIQPWLAAGKDPITGNPLHFAWVRFLNGERGNRETALKRWHITCEWRYDNNIDGMLSRPHRLFFLIKAHYPHFYYGRSKYGNPIYIEQVGKVNTKPIRAGGGKLKDMIFHYIYTAEFMWNVLEPTEYGSSLTILDVEGIGFFDFAGEAVEFVKKATAVVQEHYPERGFMVFIINAPLWFTSIWAVVSTWVNPHTREKIKILGKNYQDELFKAVERDQLPECYGGTNKRVLQDSDEEKMLRNIAIRALLKSEVSPPGPDGKPLSHADLQAMLDPSVDGLMYKSQMHKTLPDGTKLCDETGRPIEKKF